jgi:hypothetical protein
MRLPISITMSHEIADMRVRLMAFVAILTQIIEGNAPIHP